MSIESAKSKLQDEAKGCGGLEKAIAAHLISVMDEELAAMVDRPDYTLKEMGSFVMAKARKELNRKSGYLEDEVVYGFATDYYHASRGEIKKAAASTSGNVSTVPRNVEKKQEKGKETSQPIKALKKAEEKPKAQKPAKKEAAEGQLSMFDLMGGFADA